MAYPLQLHTPHPNAVLIKPAAVASSIPSVSHSSLVVSKAVTVGQGWSPVPSHEAWREWHPAQDVPSQAKVQAGEVRAAGSIVEHVHSVALLDCIWSQLEREGFQSAEEHQGEAQVPCPSWEYEGSRWGTPPGSALKEQLRPGVPQEAVTRQINVSSEVDGLCLGRIVWLRSHEDNSILQAYSVLCIMLYTMVHNLLYMLIRTCRFLPRKQWLSQSNG